MKFKRQAYVFGAAGSAALLAPVLAAPPAHAVQAAPSRSQPERSSANICAPKSAAPTPSTRLLPQAIKHLSDGGNLYIYQVGAHQLEFPVPPAGFNSLRASTAELAQYGLPPQPSNPQARAEWNRLAGALSGHVRAPSLSVRAALPNAFTRSFKPPTPAVAFSEVDSNNWTGYVSEEGQSNYYTNVQATWTQPSIGSTSCSNATHSTWVGIGGYIGSNQLLQAGTDQNNQAWFEYLGPSGSVPQQIFPNNITINSGDSVLAGTAYTPNQAWFLVQDQTTGESTMAGVSGASPFYDGSSVEFIDERTEPCNNCTPNPLADYSTTSWAGAEAATGNGYKNPASTLPGLQYLNMYNQNSNSYDLLASVSGGSNSSPDAFQTMWKNCS